MRHDRGIYLEVTMAYENETKRYDDMYEQFAKKTEEDKKKAKARKEEDYNEKLKQLYISRMQDQKTLDTKLANSGIRGGATETSNLKLATNYQTNRNNMQKEKTRALEDIETQANDNLFNYKQTTDASKLSYIEQREAEDRQIAQTKKENEEAANTDLLTAKYAGVYNVSTLNRAYNNATTTREKAIIQARIAYLQAHANGY